MNPVIKILLFASVFSNFATGLLGPIYAIFVEEIGGDILSAGSTWRRSPAVLSLKFFAQNFA